MSSVIATSGKPDSGAACENHDRVARSLLGYGVLAGPFYVTVTLVQALFLRPGFDLGHDDVSLLSNGSLGWIQVANFLLTGLMVVAWAVGVRRALGPGTTWAPVLLAMYGIGMIGAGIFSADPMNGFPAGAPAGRPETITVHGMLHIVFAGLGFLAFVGACFVMARRFARRRNPAWMWFSLTTGVVFLAAFAGVASGSSSEAVVIGFWIGLLVAWAWIGGLAVHLYRRA